MKKTHACSLHKKTNISTDIAVGLPLCRFSWKYQWVTLFGSSIQSYFCPGYVERKFLHSLNMPVLQMLTYIRSHKASVLWRKYYLPIIQACGSKKNSCFEDHSSRIHYVSNLLEVVSSSIFWQVLRGALCIGKSERTVQQVYKLWWLGHIHTSWVKE